MAPKRKSDASDLSSDEYAPAKKTARKSDASDASTSSKSSTSSTASSWKDVKLEGEDEDELPIYDECGEIRRKIRLLQKEPNFKVTTWLKEIGNINSNSYRRFMAEKDKSAGRTNGTYVAAYVYFEKRRILEGKKKTATRISNEAQYPHGFPLMNTRRGWVFGP